MNQARAEAPPEALKYFEIADLLSGAVLAVDLSGQRNSSLTAYANNAQDGDRIEELILSGIEEFRTNAFDNEQFRQIASSGDPIQQAAAAYAERSFERQVELFTPRRGNDRAFVIGDAKVGDPTSPTMSIAVIGVLVALLLPAVQAAREAARRNQSLNNVKQLGLSLHNYHDTRGTFPAAAITSADGTPLLSWRVAILPFIEEQALYDRFHLDEPWDSPHNKPLLAEMPETFFDPSSGLVEAGGKTHYLAVSGPEAIFRPGQEGLHFRSMTDGTSRTICLVQVDDANAVEWTKPADYDMAAHSPNPVSGIGELHPGVFLAGFADGSVRPIPTDTPPATLRALFTRDGREQVQIP